MEVTFPMDEVRAAVKAKEVRVSDLASAARVTVQTVYRWLKGKGVGDGIDPPESAVKCCYERLQAIRAERAAKAAQPSPVASAGDLRSEAV